MKPTSVPTVILQRGRGRWLRFGSPDALLVAWGPCDVAGVLAEVDRATARGWTAAGYLAYEAAPGLDPALRTHELGERPLAWFGLFAEPRVTRDPPAAAEAADALPLRWRPSTTKTRYAAAIRRIHDYLRAGDTYQVNYTIRLRARFGGDPYGLFWRMNQAQNARHGAYLAFDDVAICSASPELFFELAGDAIVSRPMKGTAPRGLTPAEDAARVRELAASPKNRAENVMIVDMIRNDLGRIAVPGSVHVPRSFAVETYPTVHQMVSVVSARTHAPVAEILAATFPCASVTGAPKPRTMAIIAELEPDPRGVYCGTIGYVAPGRRARFNVAIRTATVDRAHGVAEYGVGGGIVTDSRAEAEYAECLDKARVLAESPRPFELLETLRWTPGEGFVLLPEHRRRLRESAAYFGFRCDPEAVVAHLRKAVRGAHSALRVRLRLAAGGHVTVETEPLVPRGGDPVRLGLARTPVDRSDRFLYHKTTRREVYERARAERPDCDDVLLFNGAGEATESSIANLVVEMAGRRYTPPVASGLLPGTFRAMLLREGRVTERTIRVEELRADRRLWLVNSVRGWMPARFVR
jgi:para-aminobenzoate synthetase/4-amino-4-deoxychorismate lyase